MKILRVILVCILIFSMLAGCENSSTLSDKATPSDDHTDPTTTTPQEKEPENGISLGYIENNIYTNEYMGYSCKLDSNWVIQSAEQLQEIPGYVQDVYSETEFSELFENIETIIDMKAENTQEMTGINVLYTKLTDVQKLSFLTASEENIVDATLQSKDVLIASYDQIGIKNASIEKTTVTFLGEQHTAMHTTATINGMNYYVLQMFVYLKGDYYITITMNSLVSDKTFEMLDLWYIAQ